MLRVGICTTGTEIFFTRQWPKRHLSFTWGLFRELCESVPTSIFQIKKESGRPAVLFFSGERSGGREKIIKIEWRKWNWVRKAYFLTLTTRVQRAWGNKNCVLLAAAVAGGRKWQCKCEADGRRLFVFVDLIINWKMREGGGWIKNIFIYRRPHGHKAAAAAVTIALERIEFHFVFFVFVFLFHPSCLCSILKL